MPRLFTGLELPEGVKEALARLRMPLPGAKWVEQDNLHLTLCFIGDVADNKRIEEFIERLADVSVPVFETKIMGLGTFGGNDPHVLYADVAPCPELDQLAAAHEKAARDVGFSPERRKFKGHVTLARMRNARQEALLRVLQRHGRLQLPPVTIEHATLFSAKPLTGGGPYAVEERFFLQGSGGAAYYEADAGW
jgi:RNA 2',3'-cyclic 3'-phosphodiesterase